MYTERVTTDRACRGEGECTVKGNKSKRWLLAVLLGVLAACMLLGACSGDSCVSSCGLLRSIWEPELNAVEDGLSVPSITGTLSADKVNVQLEEYYTSIISVIETANEASDMFSLVHELVSVDHSYYLHSGIVCSVGGRIDLPRVYIPYAGETEIPRWVAPEELSSAEETAAWMELKANGVDFGLDGLGETASVRETLSTFVGYYRSLSKWEIDTSRFAESVDYDQLCREAMVLSLIPGEYEYEYTEAIDPLWLMRMSSELLTAMINDACGTGSAGFSGEDLLEAVRVFAGMGIVDSENWSTDAELIGMLIDKQIGEMTEEDRNTEYTRRDISRILVELFEMMYGVIDIDSDGWFPDGADDDACKKASHAGIMENLNDQRIFEPDFAPGQCMMPEMVYNFLYFCVLERNEDVFTEEVTRGDVMQALSAVDTCVRMIGLSKEEPREVNNSRDYDWYYTQHGTGWFSSVNCMPTIAMMATKWYDEDTDVTIEEMRMRYYPEYSDGWYTWQVAECLTENGVPNRVEETTKDSAVRMKELDSGRIMLTQMSEAPMDESGHCFVIYGYWRLGDTVKYYIHDSDVYDGIDEFGQRPGKAMVLDSRYCEWIIDRIAFSYISVGDGAEAE